MRDKFSELIDAGVASFQHVAYDDHNPAGYIDEICRAYNNIFGAVTDTHMSMLKDGSENRIITGSIIKTKNWSKFLYANTWGGWTINHLCNNYNCTMQCYCLADFLTQCGLRGTKTVINGDDVYLITNIMKIPSEVSTPNSYTTSESSIPRPVSDLLQNTSDIIKFQECFEQNDVVEALNKSPYVKSNNWIQYNEDIIGYIGNKTVVLEGVLQNKHFSHEYIRYIIRIDPLTNQHILKVNMFDNYSDKREYWCINDRTYEPQGDYTLNNIKYNTSHIDLYGILDKIIAGSSQRLTHEDILSSLKPAVTYEVYCEHPLDNKLYIRLAKYTHKNF